jgi:hypothetical protein
LELDISLNFGVWLQGKMLKACDEQTVEFWHLVGNNQFRLSQYNNMIAMMWSTWHELEGGSMTELMFINSNTLVFNNLYDNYAVDHVIDPTIPFVPVPDCCNDGHRSRQAELEDLIERITKYESLLAWLEEETDRACDAKRDEIRSIMVANQSRLTQTLTNVGDLLTALLGLKQKFDGDGNGIYSFSTFSALKNADYRAGDEQTLPDIDVMIVVPSVPLKCKPSTHEA